MEATPIARSTRDPDLFARLLRPKDGRFTVTGPGAFAAEYRRVDLTHVGMQAATETLPRIFQGSPSARHLTLTLLLQPGAPMYACGFEIDRQTVGALSASSPEFCLRLSGPSEWATMSMTHENWAQYGKALAGREPAFLPFRYTHVPAKGAVDRLRRLLKCTGRLAAGAPGLLLNSEVARVLDNSIIEAAIACALPADEPKVLHGARQHAAIIRKFTALVEQDEQKPFYLAEVCIALGVSGRTLRQCCSEYFGVGPKRYLLLRRLHLVRRSLLNAVPGEETVTSIATRFGFWELGRFSVAYHDLFGEPPVATLRRCGTQPDQDLGYSRRDLRSWR